MVRDENYTSPLDTDNHSDAHAADDPQRTADRQFVDQQTEDSEVNQAETIVAVAAAEHDDAVATLDSAGHPDTDDDTPIDQEWQDANEAWQSSETIDAVATDDTAIELAETIADPFVGRWNRLISSTNWEKGRIISQWRAALIDAGAAVTEFSDEAWAKRVGGVTASHVGRLRRVYDVFGASYETYQGLYWTHFLVALDWDDAPLWLEGAVQSGWSVSQMRTQRWQATGCDEQDRPLESELASSELDEDFDQTIVAGQNDQPEQKFTQPGQGGGSTKQYGDGPEGITAGPAVEGPDFGDEESLNKLSDDFHQNAAPVQPSTTDISETPPPLVQPFAGLPELPNDLADAVELMKLAVLRHKTAGWKEVEAGVVLQYLKAFEVLVEARGR
jgi:hypothetical protein